jgi:serine/threonine protein kinase
MTIERYYTGHRSIGSRRYRISEKIGGGGEGDVFCEVSDPRIALKLYHDERDSDAREQKLLAMLHHAPKDAVAKELGFPSIAWPSDLVYADGRFVGFVMPRVADTWSLKRVFNPYLQQTSAAQEGGYVPSDWKTKHEIAWNLCVALCSLHAEGHVMADVNPGNVRVGARPSGEDGKDANCGLVTLVDTDSYQIRDGSEVHLCLVGIKEYLAPELHDKRFDQVVRTVSQDNFSLAVLIYQILMEGHHPFSGLSAEEGGEPVHIRGIRNGAFPWAQGCPVDPPPTARPFEKLSPNVANLFLKCFHVGHVTPTARPSAEDWFKAIGEEKARLNPCEAGKHYVYPGTGPCYECTRESPESPTGSSAWEGVSIPLQRPVSGKRPPGSGAPGATTSGGPSSTSVRRRLSGGGTTQATPGAFVSPLSGKKRWRQVLLGIGTVAAAYVILVLISGLDLPSATGKDLEPGSSELVAWHIADVPILRVPLAREFVEYACDHKFQQNDMHQKGCRADLSWVEAFTANDGYETNYAPWRAHWCQWKTTQGGVAGTVDQCDAQIKREAAEALRAARHAVNP